jgi:hypothetical protein
MKHSVVKTLLAISVASISVLAISPAYAINAKDRIAVINADGTRESGQALATTSRLSAGVYEVFWNRSIRLCSATITVGSPTSFGASASYATAVERAGSGGFGHFIVIRDFNGTSVDSEFMITVSCRTL